MTQNQIKFAELQEAKRHNLAVENKDIKTLEESARHNVATEQTNWYAAQSQSVSAAAQASQAASKQAEVEKSLRQEMLQDVDIATKSIGNIISPMIKLFA